MARFASQESAAAALRSWKSWVSNIETRRIRVRTRPGASIQVRGSQNRRIDEPITIYGATFEHVAGPTRPIEGVVRDRETGRPLAGVRIDSTPSRGEPFILSEAETTTDFQGRYRLVGLPLGAKATFERFPWDLSTTTALL